MVSQLHSIQRSPTLFSSEIAAVAIYLSFACFSRLQLELPYCRLAHGFTSLYRARDEDSSDYSWFGLLARARFSAALAARGGYLEAIANTVPRDHVDLHVGGWGEDLGFLPPQVYVPCE